MLQISGSAGGTTLTGTLYERGERAPSFRGAPEANAPYVWVCDEFYAVASGGAVQRFGDEDVRVAFESPMPRGFEDRDVAVEAAKDHVRTQFARAGVPEADVEVTVEQVESAGAEA
jgi:hypothetical protein